jgi:hypothetical protein
MISYLFAILFTINFVVMWNVTMMPLHISYFLFKKSIPEEASYDREAWENWVIMKFDYLGELAVCPMCHGHWVALISGGVSMAICPTDEPWFFPFLCMFTIPWMAYFVLRKLSS